MSFEPLKKRIVPFALENHHGNLKGPPSAPPQESMRH